jgi:hypothetical protein
MEKDEVLLQFLMKLGEKIDSNQTDTHRRLEDLHQKLDAHADKEHETWLQNHKILVDNAKYLAEYNASLKEHMRRTEQLEERVDPIEKDFTDRTVTSRVFWSKIKTASIVIGCLGGIAGLGWSILSIIEFLQNSPILK